MVSIIKEAWRELPISELSVMLVLEKWSLRRTLSPEGISPINTIIPNAHVLLYESLIPLLPSVWASPLLPEWSLPSPPSRAACVSHSPCMMVLTAVASSPGTANTRSLSLGSNTDVCPSGSGGWKLPGLGAGLGCPV